MQLAEYTDKEVGLDDYLYLAHHSLVYSYVTGLDQGKFNDSANSIL